MPAGTNWPALTRFAWVRVSKSRFLVTDNRHHVIVATCDVEERAKRVAALLNRDSRD